MHGMIYKDTEFLVLSSAARMPGRFSSRYRRVGVVEALAGAPRPKMLSARARGVVRVVQTWERLHVGRTPRAAYQAALADAHRLATRANGGPLYRIESQVVIPGQRPSADAWDAPGETTVRFRAIPHAWACVDFLRTLGPVWREAAYYRVVEVATDCPHDEAARPFDEEYDDAAD